jgi:cytidylate kinase
VDLSFDQVYKDLCERDEQDTTRSVDPLQVVPEAWVLDTSELTIAQVVEMIVTKVQQMRA